jgi:hypothetical protein
MIDQEYARGWNEPANTNQAVTAGSRRPAYENSWAAIADNLAQTAPANHLPITRAQEMFLTPSQPYIETLPWQPLAPEYFPIPPQVRPFPLMPDEIGPVPFIGPNRLDGNENDYEPRPVPDDEECNKQWADAAQDCMRQAQKLKARSGGRYVDFDMNRCMKGLVSEACGGNPVDWGKWGKPTA